MKMDHRIAIYLKVIEYKRSIGMTQWTVFSIFVTASGGITALSLGNNLQRLSGIFVRALGVVTFWIGLLLYSRYRKLNAYVAEYLRSLEEGTDLRFQQRLGEFHSSGISTATILKLAGLFYTLFCFATVFLKGTK